MLSSIGTAEPDISLHQHKTLAGFSYDYSPVPVTSGRIQSISVIFNVTCIDTSYPLPQAVPCPLSYSVPRSLSYVVVPSINQLHLPLTA